MGRYRCKAVTDLVTVGALIANAAASAQQAPITGKPCPPDATPASCIRDVTVHNLPRRFLHDHKRIWSFPKSLADGKHITLTGAISFSRVAEKAHFPSDVFLGSTLGYTIARYSVLSNP